MKAQKYQNMDLSIVNGAIVGMQQVIYTKEEKHCKTLQLDANCYYKPNLEENRDMNYYLITIINMDICSISVSWLGVRTQSIDIIL